MSTQGMQKLVGRMVTSDHFRNKVLFSRDEGLFSSFDLTPTEVSIIMGIEAEDLAGFARGVESYIDSRNRISPGKLAGVEKG